MSQPIQFEALIEEAPRGGACIPVPFDPREVFGTARSMRVVATYDGFEARSNVVTMGGRAVLGIHKATREAIGKGPGDEVRVTLVRDAAPRTVEVPAELVAIFDQDPGSRAAFDRLSFTHRREFAEWVGGAKRQETRDRRAVRTVEMLRTGQTP